MRYRGFTKLLLLAVILGVVAASTTWASRFKRYPTHSDTGPLMHPSHTETPAAPALRQPTAPQDPANDEIAVEPEGAEEEAVVEEVGTLFSHQVLEAPGVAIDYVYTGEAYNNTRGGLNTSGATEYRGNFDLAMTFDMEDLSSIPGGTFFLYGQELHGRSMSVNHVGDFQYLSNIDNTENFTQFSEYWWQQELADGLIWAKVGKQDANADFCALDLGGDFLNSSFGLIPNVPVPIFPHPGLGAALFAQLTDQLSFGAGVYDGAPVGTTWGFSSLGSNGSMTIAEMKLDPQLAIFGGKPAAYRAGAWYHGGAWDALDGSGTFNGNHGYYLAFDQLIVLEEEDEEQGLGFFLQYGTAPEDRNSIENYFGAGLLYRGPVAGRDEDLTGVGVGHAKFSSDLRNSDGMTYESAIEAFYRAQLSPWAAIQPDVQFIANPGGNLKDAMTVGIRFEVVL